MGSTIITNIDKKNHPFNPQNFFPYFQPIAIFIESSQSEKNNFEHTSFSETI